MVNIRGNQSKDIIFGWGNEAVTPDWIGELITQMPSCSILMKQEYAEIFKAKCDELGYTYHFHSYDGTINTH